MASHHTKTSNSKLDSRALRRLVITQLGIRRYNERRTEHIGLKDNQHYAVQVDHQFTVPGHGDNKANGEQDILIPLGNFAKDRLPDLVVTGPDGQRVPVLGRAARGEAVATLFGSQWQHLLFDPVATNATGDEVSEAESLWSVVLLTIARVVTRPQSDAERLTADLRTYLESYLATTKSQKLREGVSALVESTDFRRKLDDLVKVRLLIARFQGEPGQTYVLCISYTEAMGKDGYGTGLLRRFLAWLGLIAIPVSRQAANCSQAASFWVMATAPKGVEILRLFWQNDRDDIPGDESISVDAGRALAGRYEWARDKPEENELLIDVQIAPSASVAGTIGLAAILLYLSRYVYQGFPRPGLDSDQRTILLAFGTIIVTIPTAIAGALAYKGELFSRWACRGPRFMVGLLSVLGAALAVTVSLKGITNVAEWVAYGLSVYCVIVIGLFAYIQVGFRWRNNDAARFRRWRSLSSPDHCRKKQTRLAVLFSLIWLLVIIAFAKCQVVLQHKHFFTAFPREILRAWS